MSDNDALLDFTQAYTKEISSRRRNTIIKIVLVVIIGIYLVSTLRYHYSEMITALGENGWKCAIVNEYPFLSSLFFHNDATAGTMVALYYGLLKQEYALSGSLTFQDAIMPASNWQRTENTAVYYMEHNLSAGLDDVVKWMDTQNMFKTAPASPDLLGDAKEALNAAITYGMPILMLVSMIAI